MSADQSKTTTPDELRALIARVEAAEGADRELDAAIPATLGVGMTVGEYLAAGLSVRDPKPYTSSLDAAVSLVPEGWFRTAHQTLASSSWRASSTRVGAGASGNDIGGPLAIRSSRSAWHG